MSDEIKKLDKKGLRDFGLLIGGLIAVLFGLAVPLLRRSSLPWWPWAICAILVVLALVAPKSLNPVYHGWIMRRKLNPKMDTYRVPSKARTKVSMERPF
ncbi:MAG: sxtJ [Oscillatoriales cyanobacterium]|nr:MAG: sxtJ [Oscillatoriales cyanobacterium]